MSKSNIWICISQEKELYISLLDWIQFSII